MKSRILSLANLHIVVLVFVAMTLLPGLASAAWRDLGGSEPATVTVLEDDGTRSVIEVIVGGFDAQPVDIEGEQYYLISLPREGIQKEVGLPQLPNVRRSLIIPDDRAMGVTVLEAEYVDIPDMPVAPSKGFLPRTVDPSSVAYTFSISTTEPMSTRPGLPRRTIPTSCVTTAAWSSTPTCSATIPRPGPCAFTRAW